MLVSFVAVFAISRETQHAVLGGMLLEHPMPVSWSELFIATSGASSSREDEAGACTGATGTAPTCFLFLLRGAGSFCLSRTKILLLMAQRSIDQQDHGMGSSLCSRSTP